MRAPRRDVAIVFQDYGKALLPWRTAAGNVALALETIGMPKAQRPARIDELLKHRRPALPRREISRRDVRRHAAAAADRPMLWRRNRKHC